MKRMVRYSFLLFLILSCQSKPSFKKQVEGLDDNNSNNNPQGVLTKRMNDLFWGKTDVIVSDTSNPIELVAFYLNKSQFGKAVGVIKDKFNYDTVFTGGFWGFKEKPKYEANKYKLYTYFRVNDYSGNVIGNYLSSQFVLSLTDSSSLLNRLQQVEYYYVQDKSAGKHEQSLNLIPQLISLKKDNPEAKRLDFLLANEYFAIGENTHGLRLFDYIIKQDYYALPSLRIVTGFLARNKSPLLKKYTDLLDQKFPRECNLSKIENMLPGVAEKELLYECVKCYGSIFQSDSIYARLFLIKFYLDGRQLNKVDLLVDEYLNNIDKEPYDDERNYIAGRYFDFKLRSLFLQKRYKEFRYFIENELRSNPVVNIASDNDFGNYLQKLYQEYISTDLGSFRKFGDNFLK